MEEVDRDGRNDKTPTNKERDYLKRGKDCYVKVTKSYKEMLRSVIFETKTDIVQGARYPFISSLNVQSNISRIAITFETLQSNMNEAMHEFLPQKDFEREVRNEKLKELLQKNKSFENDFLSDLKKLRNEGEDLLAITQNLID